MDFSVIQIVMPIFTCLCQRNMSCELYYFPVVDVTWDIKLDLVNKKPVYLGSLYIVDSKYMHE